jgi:hypothetical protein
METLMNTRKTWIFGLAAIGLALAAPVHAAPGFMDGGFIVARNDRDKGHQDMRDARKEDPRADRRETERAEPRGYGYGYERRQQQRAEEEHRQRGRR